MSYVKELIQNVLNSKEEQKALSLETETYLVISQDNQNFAISIDFVNEVVELNSDMRLMRVPLAPDYIHGIINVRGDIIPVVSLNAILSLSYDTQKFAYVVIIDKDFKLGIAAEKVHDLVQVSSDKLKPIYHLQTAQAHEILASEFDFEDNVAQVLHVSKFYESSYLQ